MTASSLPDKAILKNMVIEILKEEPQLIKAIVKEVLEENQIIISDPQQERRKQIEAMINEDFDKYDNVFKALA